MKKFILFALLSLLAFGFSAQAQTPNYRSSRLDELADQLKRQTVDLADRASNDLRRGYNNSRADIEAAFLAQQFDASAGFFQQMARDNRSASELRDAASILSDLARRAPSYGSNGNLWRNAQTAINDISRELGGYNGGGSTGGDDNQTPVAGRAFWRGTVDNEVQLVIRDNNIETRTISGTPYADGTFNFTSPLPTRRKTIEVIKKKGRGNVRVLQQPTRDNNFSAIVQIQDRDGGAKEYQLEIFWR
ncbi:MAG: hypothetical protein M3033_06560 [Acidobacteriota bacterium]|nr:hypothetical protein [Acidobacteriota bacterium]